MHPEMLRGQVEELMRAAQPRLEAASRGDVIAQASIQADAKLPEPLKQMMRANPSAGAALEPLTTQVAESLDQELRLAFSEAITGALQWMLIVVLLGAVLGALVPQLPLGQHQEPAAPGH